MRAVLVINSLGSFPPHQMAPLRAALSLGWEVHLVAPASPAAAEAVAMGAVYHPVFIPRGLVAPWWELGTLWRLWRLYRRLRPQLVHHMTAKPVIFGGLAARLAGVPIVVATTPGLGGIFAQRGFRAGLLRGLILAGFRQAARHPRCRFIIENESDRERLVMAGVVPAEHTTLVLISGVDPKVFHPEPEAPGPPVVLLASRLLWDKGIGTFVEAARRLRAQGVRARFVLAGDPDPGNPASIPRAQLEAWVREGNVEWLGHRNDMPHVLAASHVCCLPTVYGEGTPRFLLEAAASGRPLVSTDWPGCREVAQHGVTGLLVPPRDPEFLAGALRALIEAPSLRAQYGQAARRLVLERFTADRAVADTTALYRSLVEQAGGRA